MPRENATHINLLLKNYNGFLAGPSSHKEKPKSQPSFNLDSVVTANTYKNSALIDEKAVEKIHSKSNFNLKRLIGKALAKQVESVLLDSSLLTLGDTLGEGKDQI